MSKEDYIARLLSERDTARAGGDQLAIMIRRLLKGKVSKARPGNLERVAKIRARSDRHHEATHQDMHKALMDYCVSQGWNGPAGSWTKEILAYEDEQKEEDKVK